MAITYEPIATTTLSSAASSVTFSSISGSYTDLVLVITSLSCVAGIHFYVSYTADGRHVWGMDLR